jgi:hypothetical protein
MPPPAIVKNDIPYFVVAFTKNLLLVDLENSFDA